MSTENLSPADAPLVALRAIASFVDLIESVGRQSSAALRVEKDELVADVRRRLRLASLGDVESSFDFAGDLLPTTTTNNLASRQICEFENSEAARDLRDHVHRLTIASKTSRKRRHDSLIARMPKASPLLQARLRLFQEYLTSGDRETDSSDDENVPKDAAVGTPLNLERSSIVYEAKRRQVQTPVMSPKWKSGICIDPSGELSGDQRNVEILKQDSSSPEFMHTDEDGMHTDDESLHTNDVDIDELQLDDQDVTMGIGGMQTTSIDGMHSILDSMQTSFNEEANEVATAIRRDETPASAQTRVDFRSVETFVEPSADDARFSGMRTSTEPPTDNLDFPVVVPSRVVNSNPTLDLSATSSSSSSSHRSSGLPKSQTLSVESHSSDRAAFNNPTDEQLSSETSLPKISSEKSKIQMEMVGVDFKADGENGDTDMHTDELDETNPDARRDDGGDNKSETVGMQVDKMDETADTKIENKTETFGMHTESEHRAASMHSENTSEAISMQIEKRNESNGIHIENASEANGMHTENPNKDEPIQAAADITMAPVDISRPLSKMLLDQVMSSDDSSSDCPMSVYSPPIRPIELLGLDDEFGTPSSRGETRLTSQTDSPLIRQAPASQPSAPRAPQIIKIVPTGDLPSSQSRMKLPTTSRVDLGTPTRLIGTSAKTSGTSVKISGASGTPRIGGMLTPTKFANTIAGGGSHGTLKSPGTVVGTPSKLGAGILGTPSKLAGNLGTPSSFKASGPTTPKAKPTRPPQTTTEPLVPASPKAPRVVTSKAAVSLVKSPFRHLVGTLLKSPRIAGSPAPPPAPSQVICTPCPPAIARQVEKGCIRQHRQLKTLGPKVAENNIVLSEDESHGEGKSVFGKKKHQEAQWVKGGRWRELVRQQRDVDPLTIFGLGSRPVHFEQVFNTPDFQRAAVEAGRHNTPRVRELTTLEGRQKLLRRWDNDRDQCGFQPHEGASVDQVHRFRAKTGRTRDVSSLVFDSSWVCCGETCEHNSALRQPWFNCEVSSPDPK